MTIEVVDELAALRAQVAEWRGAGARIGFVPTMGNLHDGHFSLVHRAREHCDRVVASIFVNPTQFGPNEDFARYPRTPDTDTRGLDAVGCDLLWMPGVATMYPLGADDAVRVHVPGITDTLEGAHRPGHFDGVATVVSRLLLQAQPDVAVFGRKDYQQLAVIRRLVADLSFPVEIIAGDTVREASGLAMSSRNQYLSTDERERAALIHRTLLAMRDAVAGGTSLDVAEHEATDALTNAGFEVDYAAIRRRDLGTAAPANDELVALIAARIGRTRLIDNLEFSRG